MKRFKDLEVIIGSDSQAIEELVKIKERCDGILFTFSVDVENLFQQNDRILHIIANVPETPEAILLVFANDGNIKVINIVPPKSGNDALTKEQYNRIVDFFNNTVLQPLMGNRYRIIVTSDTVKMEDIIPKSYQSLVRFVESTSIESPFSHPLDREKWYEFVCKLSSNNEYLSSGDLRQWLLEDMGRDDNLVDIIIDKYEDATELLDYYDRNYNVSHQ